MKKSLFLFVALFAILFCSSDLNAQKYCILDGTKYEMGVIIKKFGKNASAVKGCCNMTRACGKGYASQAEGAHINYDLSLLAAKYNHFDALKYLVEVHNCEVETWPWETKSVEDYKDYTQLMYAVRNGNLDMVKYLLSKGISARTQNKDRKDALDFASASGNKDITSAVRDAWHGLKVSHNINLNEVIEAVKFKSEITNMKTLDYSKVFSAFKSKLNLDLNTSDKKNLQKNI